MASSGGSGGAWVEQAEVLWAALREDAPLPADALRGLLRRVMEAPPEAVWHPTGFLVLTLLRRDDGGLRLHVWPESARELGRPCWPVHDHVWELRSHVLCGEVESRGYRVVEDERGDAVLYAVGYGEGRSSCMRKSERRVSVRELAPRRVVSGERYTVAAGEFHASTVASGDFAATLVATRLGRQPWPWVVGGLDAPTVVPVERPLAAAAWVQALLRRSLGFTVVDDR
jgi:hypothetical protein